MISNDEFLAKFKDISNLIIFKFRINMQSYTSFFN